MSWARRVNWTLGFAVGAAVTWALLPSYSWQLVVENHKGQTFVAAQDMTNSGCMERAQQYHTFPVVYCEDVNYEVRP